MSGDVVINFSVGDVVKLKSGGPDMTVRKVEGNHVYCTWMVSAAPPNAWVEDFGFNASMLEPSKRVVPMQATFQSNPAEYLKAQEAKPTQAEEHLRWHASSIRRVQGGANYATGEILTLSCEPGDEPIVVRVTGSVLGGAITDISMQAGGAYKQRQRILHQASTTGIGSDASFEVQGWFYE